MQWQTSTRRRESDRQEAVAAVPHREDESRAHDLIRRWLELSEVERRAFIALTRELSVTSELVETSTLDLSERFQQLATVAQAQMGQMNAIVSAVQSVVVNGQAVPLDEALRSVEGLLRKVIETILTISKHAMRMVYALDDVSRDVASAEQSVVQIEVINTQTRYLALNAAIEASRSGEAGAAFRVIAREVKDLSAMTDKISKQVRDRIFSVTTGVRKGHAVLQEIATLDMSEHILARENLDSLIAGLKGQNQTFGVVLGEAAAKSAEMARTIGQMITGMQFQDRTKQHIEQVIAVLTALEESTLSIQQATVQAYPGTFAAGAIDAELLSRIVEKQTLGAVKQRLLMRLLSNTGEAADGDHEGQPGNADSASDNSHAGDVELF